MRDDAPASLFVEALSTAQPVGGAFNPWREWDDTDVHTIPAPLMRQDRLLRHLSVEPRLILVGEAPGYQGCRYSGVPFTSERLIMERLIPRVWNAQYWPEVRFPDRVHEEVMERITKRAKPWSEPSATIVWRALHGFDLAEHTVLWNAFPFHPHRPGEPHSNATPTIEQLLSGREWLVRFLNLPNLRSARVLPVGQKAAAMLDGILPPDRHRVTLRHPANGGARLFSEGLGAYALKLAA